MKILVTGGAGFIGSHLVNRLVSAGHDVVVLDNFYSGKKENVNKKAKLIEGDITDASEVARAMRGCSHVFHLAAISEARAKDDNLVYNTNFMGSKNVFEAAKGAKVIFTSSAAVYGELKSAKETDETKPVNQYGKSKLRAEKIAPENSFIARLFNVYGPGGHGVVNRFASLMPKYKPITVYGHGTQSRDFVHVSDVVDAFMLGLSHSGTYNIGTGVEKSVTDIIKIINELTRSTPEIVYAPLVQGDVQRSRADISKAAKIGWKPKVELKEGVRQLVAQYGFDFSVVEKLR